MANEFKVRKGLIVQGSGSIILDIQGSQGELFSVTDSLSGSLFSVNDISGIPIMEVFSDNIIKMGTFNQEAIIVSGSRTGMGIATPQAKLHISGATSQQLLEIDAGGSATPVFVVSGSGNVGIGTTSPTQKLDVRDGFIQVSGSGAAGQGITIARAGLDTYQLTHEDGGLTIKNFTDNVKEMTFLGNGNVGINETNPSARLEIKGSGATSATTALRIENSAATARLTMLDDGTSAFNTSHLYVSGSGRVAVGTVTPQRLFDVYNGTTSGIAASFGAQVGINQFSGLSFGYVEQANTLYRKSALIFERTDGHGGGGNASGKIHFLLNNNTSTSATALTDAVLTIDSVGTTAGTSRVGIGTRFPTASLHISGTVATDNLMRVQSTTGAEYFFISASGNVGIGTNLPSADLHISGASADSLLRVGSPTDSSILFVTGSGRVGIGTTSLDSKLHISSNGGYQLRVAASASFSSSLMVSGSFGFVGIGVESPQSILHVNDRPEFNNVTGNVAATFAGNYQNITTFYNNNNQDNTVLGEPAAWMNIKCDGTEYLIPLYTS